MSAQGRHAEVLQLIDPMTALKGEIQSYKRNALARPATAESGTGRGSRAFVIQRAAALARALSEAGRDDEAVQPVAELQRFDNSPAARKASRDAIRAAGREDLMQRLDAANGGVQQ